MNGRQAFTVRQLEVVALAREGLNRREIAERLGVRIETIRGHVRAIEKKLPKVSQGLARIRLYAHQLVEAAPVAWDRKIMEPAVPNEAERRRRANARAYANVYKRRGKLTPQPCEDCGKPDTEMHHEDYSEPLRVVWLCADCHNARHRAA